MSFQRTPATETQFAAASKRTSAGLKGDYQGTIKHTASCAESDLLEVKVCHQPPEVENMPAYLALKGCPEAVGIKDYAKTLCFATKTIMTYQNVV